MIILLVAILIPAVSYFCFRWGQKYEELQTKIADQNYQDQMMNKVLMAIRNNELKKSESQMEVH